MEANNLLNVSIENDWPFCGAHNRENMCLHGCFEGRARASALNEPRAQLGARERQLSQLPTGERGHRFKGNKELSINGTAR